MGTFLTTVPVRVCGVTCYSMKTRPKETPNIILFTKMCLLNMFRVRIFYYLVSVESLNSPGLKLSLLGVTVATRIYKPLYLSPGPQPRLIHYNTIHLVIHLTTIRHRGTHWSKLRVASIFSGKLPVMFLLLHSVEGSVFYPVQQFRTEPRTVHDELCDA